MTTAAERPTEHRLAKQLSAVLVGIVFMAICARTQVPFWPVPMTLQTFAVLALAIGLGPRLAATILASYLAAGALGLPVFAGTPERGLGLAYLAGPTGGYLVGCLLAAWVVGTLALGRGPIGRIGAMAAGLVMIFGCGLAWLAMFVPADKLVALGLLPFIPGEVAKLALVASGTALLASPLARLRRALD